MESLGGGPGAQAGHEAGGNVSESEDSKLARLLEAMKKDGSVELFASSRELRWACEWRRYIGRTFSATATTPAEAVRQCWERGQG